MGNCAFRGNNGEGNSPLIKVVTCSGGVMELYPPVTAECITNGFPGHGLFRGRDVLSRPLLHNEELVGGESYHLRPLNSPLTVVPSMVAPYRVSVDHQGHLWRRQDMEMLPPEFGGGSGGGGGERAGAVWKVKLVISPAQLAEILSHEAQTEALIESVRTVAMCGNGSAAASLASSDQWSLASSRKASLEN